MATATERLAQEHLVIQDQMAVLKRLAEAWGAGQKVSTRDIEDVLSFFEIFGDKIHHEKEEALLLPALLTHGYPLKGGPLCSYFALLLSVRSPMRDEICETSQALGEPAPAEPEHPLPILEEHQLGRNILGLMRAAVAAGDPEAFTKHARRYLEMLEEHIHKENGCLFPMVDDTLAPAQQKDLEAAFEAFDRRAESELSLERWRKTWNALQETYGQ